MSIVLNTQGLPAEVHWLLDRPEPSPDSRYTSTISEWRELNGRIYPWRYQVTMAWGDEEVWIRDFQIWEIVTGKDALARYPTGLGEAEQVWEVNNITGEQHAVPGKDRRVHGSRRLNLAPRE